jgi:uncharacterized protein (TIGR03435 family)
MLSSFVLVMLPALGTSPMAQERPSSALSAFDVASVKPSPSASGSIPSLTIRPDSLVAINYPLWALIYQAYGMTSRQVERVPGWAQTERFDIRAKSGRPSTRPEILQMLRSLLEERFQLKVRQESREVEAYLLTVEREKYPGPGLRPLDIDCITNTLSADSGPGLFPADARPRCGTVVRGTAAPDTKRTIKVRRDTYAAFTFPQFVASLEGSLSRPLRDQTGLAGTFDIELTYSEPTNPAGEKGWVQVKLTDTLVRDALRNQLGLILTPGRTAIDFLVINSIERPSPD